MTARTLMLALVLAALAGPAVAKLPAPPPMNDEQKAKAEEAKLKAAEAAKKESELLAKWQDIAVQKYAAKLKAEGKEFKPTPIAAPPAPAAAPAPSAVPAPVSAAAPPKAPGK